MRLQTSPNAWSCLPTSLAMVIDKPLKDIITVLGHDGSEILWPNIEKPDCYRSFTIPEMVFVALHFGYCLLEVIDSVTIQPTSECEEKIIFLPTKNFTNTLLKEYNALLLGESENGVPHAVAWNCKRHVIFDPRGCRISCSLFKTEYVFIVIPICK